MGGVVMSLLKGMKAAYIVAFVALLVLFGTLALAAEEKESQILTINVNIFDGKADKLAEGMSPLVEGNLITTIGDETIKAIKGVTAICGGGLALVKRNDRLPCSLPNHPALACSVFQDHRPSPHRFSMQPTSHEEKMS
jgi:hypothetical protein